MTDEPTHEGPSPYHSGLTTHRGRREDCPDPDCGPLTDDERADREETERDHARGDHTHCGVTCETELPTEHLRNFVIAKGFPGTRGALDELLRRAREERPALTDAERAMLRYALELADDRIASEPDEFTDEDEAALESLRRLVGEEPATDTSTTHLHLVVPRPEPGEWHGRLDVAEALEADGWTGDEDGHLLRKNGAVWAVTSPSDDSGLTCPNGAVLDFPHDTPAVVVIAACLAAAHPAD